ncbi:uncharacterized protein LOC142177997 [Nicotiana tabacum]|uniref:Uncharacterized protein LOC142177997 n=1 Tax=Nicotiana tabacum TaxID=4097 RepID=A0AC58U1R8_TOBAC
MAEELKKCTGKVQSVKNGKGVEGLNYEDLCIQQDVELPEAYKPPKLEMFDGIGDPKIQFNTENAPDVFYIQNLKKKLTETFRKYATRWRSEATKVRPTLEEEQMNKFFVRTQDPQYYERLMLIDNHKFSDIIKLGERKEEGINNGMVTNFEALQATNKSLQSGGISKKKEVGVVMTLIDTKVIQAKKATPNVRNNPLPDHRGEGVNVIETNEEWDQEGSIGLIRERDAPKTSLVTLTLVVVQT